MLIKPMKSADLISFFSLLLLFHNKEIWFQIMKKVYTSCIYLKAITGVSTLQLPHIYEPTSITYCQQSPLSSTSPTDSSPSTTLCGSMA